jgi:hypothetical protein
MTTVNIFSVGTFDLFLHDVLKLRKKFIKDSIKQGNILPCMTNYLRWPQMLAVTNLDEMTKSETMQKLDQLIKAHRVGLRETTDILWEDEVNQIERFIKFMNHDTVGDTKENRYNFKAFVDEYDKRRKTNFHKTFPNLTRFYNMCAEEKLNG